MPAETLAAQLLRGERKGVPDLMIREACKASRTMSARSFAIWNQELRNLEQEVRSTSAVASLRYDLNDLKSEVIGNAANSIASSVKFAGRLPQRCRDRGVCATGKSGTAAAVKAGRTASGID